MKIEAKLTDENAEQFAHSLVSKLPKIERLKILRDLQLHSDDDGNLYIRLDKQRSLLGDVQVTEDDPIRVKIKFNRLMGDCKKSMTTFLESD